MNVVVVGGGLAVLVDETSAGAVSDAVVAVEKSASVVVVGATATVVVSAIVVVEANVDSDVVRKAEAVVDGTDAAQRQT